MYIGVNVNYFVMAFQKYEFNASNQLISTFVGLENIINAFKGLAVAPLKYAVINSSILFVVNIVFNTFFSILFSYYIYKKFLFANFFRIVLFIPNILSGMVLSIMYNYFCEGVMPIVLKDVLNINIGGLLHDSPNTWLPAILVFNVLMGFGPNILIYSGAMANISDSMIEAAEIDGAGHFRELFLIVIPQIFSTITTFFVMSIAGFGTNQMYLFNFYSLGAGDKITFGYYLFAEAQKNNNSLLGYGKIAAIGLMLTIIIIPLSFLFRWIMNKYGPSEE